MVAGAARNRARPRPFAGPRHDPTRSDQRTDPRRAGRHPGFRPEVHPDPRRDDPRHRAGGRSPSRQRGCRRVGMHCGARSRSTVITTATSTITRGANDRVPLELWMNYVRPLTPIPLTPRQVYLRTLIGADSGVAIGNHVHRRRSQRQSDPGARTRRGGVPGLSRHRDPGLRRRDPVRQAVLPRASLHRRGVSARSARASSRVCGPRPRRRFSQFALRLAEAHHPYVGTGIGNSGALRLRSAAPTSSWCA